MKMKMASRFLKKWNQLCIQRCHAHEDQSVSRRMWELVILLAFVAVAYLFHESEQKHGQEGIPLIGPVLVDVVTAIEAATGQLNARTEEASRKAKSMTARKKRQTHRNTRTTEPLPLAMTTESEDTEIEPSTPPPSPKVFEMSEVEWAEKEDAEMFDQLLEQKLMALGLTSRLEPNELLKQEPEDAKSEEDGENAVRRVRQKKLECGDKCRTVAQLRERNARLVMRAEESLGEEVALGENRKGLLGIGKQEKQN